MAIKQHLDIDQGSTHQFIAYHNEILTDLNTGEPLLDADGAAQIGSPVDLTDYIARMHVRTNINDEDPLFELTDTDGIDLSTPTVTMRQYVEAATTSNEATRSGRQTIDGVSLVPGDRVLLKDQTTATQNGIYVVATGAWARASDADTAGELTTPAAVWVRRGNENADTVWVQQSAVSDLSTDAQVWAQIFDLGKIVVTLSATNTALITSNSVYDIEVESTTGVVTRVREGRIRLSREVTR